MSPTYVSPSQCLVIQHQHTSQMDSLCVIFAPALEKYTLGLLTRIASDYNLSQDELVAKYLTRPETIKAKVKKPRAPKDPNAPPKPPKVPIEDRPMCPSLTGKKTPCKNRCLPGSDKCHLHCVSLPTGEPKPPRIPKAKKVKEQPTHNHAPLVAPEAPCQLCETHGDATNPGLTNVQFESNQNGMTLQERLKMIIQMGEDAAEPEPEDEIESPGTIRHRMILAERGLPPPEYDSDSDSDEDAEMTEDEFEEEVLLD
jgi:hypothetical protein